jgi:hypothetical protein
MTRIPLPVCWEPERISHAVTLLAKLGEESGTERQELTPSGAF